MFTPANVMSFLGRTGQVGKEAGRAVGQSPETRLPLLHCHFPVQISKRSEDSKFEPRLPVRYEDLVVTLKDG